MSDALHALAAAAGVAVRWRDCRNEEREVAPDTLRAVLAAMGLPCASEAQVRDSLAAAQAENAGAALPALLTAVAGEGVAVPAAAGRIGRLTAEDGSRLEVRVEDVGGRSMLAAPAAPGYYALSLDGHEGTLAVAPARAWGVADAAPGRRLWGLAAQLYALRRRGDGGIGDFTALAELTRLAAARGAHAVALSPVHAPFTVASAHYSPYSPSSRLFLNPWHVDPAELAGAPLARELAERCGAAATLDRLEQAPLMDWPALARARRAVLRALHDTVRAGRMPGAAETLADFRRQAGEALEDHARFDALQEHLLAAGRPWRWRDWPAGLRDPRDAGVARFARECDEDVGFHAFLQWLASRGLARAQREARAAGMSIGLVADLAVGTDGGGSHAWSRQRDMLTGLSVGAPPDDLNAHGQSWGLTTFSPRALRQHGYAPFIELLRACLRHAGGVRIDHVLGLNRLWLVPEGADPTAGAYLRYPLEDLLRLIALESWRHRAIIIGEDLGTVPPGFRERLAAAGIMGLRVLCFEREQGFFTDPARWPADAVATTSTHDVATIAGWWAGRDVEWREQLGLRGETGEQRGLDRRALWDAFTHAGVAHGAMPATAAPVVDAAVRFVARTPAPLALVPLEDLAGLSEQPNLPGTVAQHPNWQRRLPAASAELLDEPAAAARLASLRAERGG